MRALPGSRAGHKARLRPPRHTWPRRPHLAHRLPGKLRRQPRSEARAPPAPRRTRGRAGAPLGSQGAPARPRRRLLHNTAGALRPHGPGSHGPGTRGPAPALPHSHRTRESSAASPEGRSARPGRPRGASSPAEPGSAQGRAAAAYPWRPRRQHRPFPAAARPGSARLSTRRSPAPCSPPASPRRPANPSRRPRGPVRPPRLGLAGPVPGGAGSCRLCRREGRGCG